MKHKARTICLLLAVALAPALSLVGCGGPVKPVRSDSGSHAKVSRLAKPQRGGILTVLGSAPIAGIDPARAATAQEEEYTYATQRPLFSYSPGSAAPLPDLAAESPAISADARTVTVHLRTGVHFSPPFDREVTSKDVAYAIERGANPHVLSPFFRPYFSVLVGGDKANGGPIRGIVTPDAHTMIFRLRRSWGKAFADALALPLSAPVPMGVARKDDRADPSRYERYAAATGPYMFKANAGGRVFGIGYIPGRSVTLVRNPAWRASTDFRPAFVDGIRYELASTRERSRAQTLARVHLVENEPPLEAAELATRSYGAQLKISPYYGLRYVAVNNRSKPFDNQEVRRALWAALDLTSMSHAWGEPLLAQPASHFIYPGMAGSRIATSLISPTLGFLRHPHGDLAVAKKLLMAAGYPRGIYTGHSPVSVIASSNGPSVIVARLAAAALRQLGFGVNLQLVQEDDVQRLCGARSSVAYVCPDAQLFPGFNDPQALLLEAFDGHIQLSRSNQDWSQANDLVFDAALEREARLVEPASREQGWGAVDNGLVTEAIGIPYAWIRAVAIESPDVAGVTDVWNRGAWDLSFSSLRPG